MTEELVERLAQSRDNSDDCWSVETSPGEMDGELVAATAGVDEWC